MVRRAANIEVLMADGSVEWLGLKEEIEEALFILDTVRSVTALGGSKFEHVWFGLDNIHADLKSAHDVLSSRTDRDL